MYILIKLKFILHENQKEKKIINKIKGTFNYAITKISSHLIAT